MRDEIKPRPSPRALLWLWGPFVLVPWVALWVIEHVWTPPWGRQHLCGACQTPHTTVTYVVVYGLSRIGLLAAVVGTVAWCASAAVARRAPATTRGS